MSYGVAFPRSRRYRRYPGDSRTFSATRTDVVVPREPLDKLRQHARRDNRLPIPRLLAPEKHVGLPVPTDEGRCSNRRDAELSSSVTRSCYIHFTMDDTNYSNQGNH